MSKGKGDSDQQLPDIIMSQEQLNKMMEKAMNKGENGKPKAGEGKQKGEKGKSGKSGKGSKPEENGKKNGKGEGSSNDDLDGELYEIFKQQSQLRQQLQNAIKESDNAKTSGNGNAKKALKTMEELENEILEML